MHSLSLYIVYAFGFSFYKVRKAVRGFEHKVLLGKKHKFIQQETLIVNLFLQMLCSLNKVVELQTILYHIKC